MAFPPILASVMATLWGTGAADPKTAITGILAALFAAALRHGISTSIASMADMLLGLVSDSVRANQPQAADIAAMVKTALDEALAQNAAAPAPK
jgi:hypothetical protein